MTKAGKFFISMGVAVFLFLSTASGFLHNHQADIYTHYNCPAYIISITLVSIALFFGLLSKIIFPKPFNITIPKQLVCTSYELITGINNRAPPF